MSVPAAVRKRWRTRTVLAEDCGDHVVLRPVADDPVAAALGAFATQIGAIVVDAEDKVHNTQGFNV